MDVIARLTPRFAGVSYAAITHIDGFARGEGKFVISEYLPMTKG